MPSRWDRCGALQTPTVVFSWKGRLARGCWAVYAPFGFELRCWRDGRIPDIAEAVESPMRTTGEVAQAESLFAVLGEVPALGRDGLRAGEMWNSNSAVSWALARSGHDMKGIHPPTRGRGPWWHAGLVLAERPDSPRPRRLIEAA
jgi:hypothetical protein